MPIQKIERIQTNKNEMVSQKARAPFQFHISPCFSVSIDPWTRLFDDLFTNISMKCPPFLKDLCTIIPPEEKKNISLRFQIEVVSPIAISCTRFPRPDCCPGNPINFVAGGGHLAPHKSGPLWHLRLKSIYKSCRPPPYHPDDESLESLCKRDVCAADPLWKMTRYAFQKLQWTVQKDPLPVLIVGLTPQTMVGIYFCVFNFYKLGFYWFRIFFFSFYLFKWSGRVVDTLWKLWRRGFQLQSINIDLSFVIKTMINVCVIEVLLVGEVGLFVNAFLCCINVNYCNRIPLNISIYYISSFLDAIEYCDL